MKDQIIKALQELKKQRKRKFNQSIDLIINLKNFDVRKESLNLFINLPHKVKEKRICAFLNKKTSLIDTITENDFKKYKDKKRIKKLTKKYDFFIASANLMQKIATNFGRYLGPVGKMPSPQLGIITNEDEKTLKQLIEKINSIVRIKTREASIKLCIGKEDMKEEEIAENASMIYNTVLNNLTRKKENIKSILIKLTMSKPIKIQQK